MHMRAQCLPASFASLLLDRPQRDVAAAEQHACTFVPIFTRKRSRYTRIARCRVTVAQRAESITASAQAGPANCACAKRGGHRRLLIRCEHRFRTVTNEHPAPRLASVAVKVTIGLLLYMPLSALQNRSGAVPANRSPTCRPRAMTAALIVYPSPR